MSPRQLIAAALVLGTAVAALADSFEEMNAQRANLGLAPLIRNEDLMKAAQYKAEWLAAHQIKAGRDYWQHRNPDGSFGPMIGAGYIEGIGAQDPGAGWCSCAMRTIGQHEAGTGLAIGEDGIRYMVLFVKGRNLPETNVVRPLVNTSWRSPNAPRIRYLGRWHPGARAPAFPRDVLERLRRRR